MTIESSTAKNQYSTNGSTTNFIVGFPFASDDELLVLLFNLDTQVETTLDLNTDYTVNGAGDPDGGSIDTVLTYDSGYVITILRNVPITQEADYTTADKFPAASHEAVLDKLTKICQQINENLKRAIKLPKSTSLSDVETTEPEDGQYPRWNAGTETLDWVALEEAGIYVNPVSNRGEMIRGNASGDQSAFSVGSSGQVIVSDGIDPGWGQASAAGLATDAVETAKIKDDAVTTAKILDANVTTPKLDDQAVTAGKIQDSTITAQQLADSAVETSKLDDDSVTVDKLAVQPYGHWRDEKAAGTDGGTFTSGAWRTRTINTEVTNTISGASLAANQLTLPAGKYYIMASAPARTVQEHKAKLYNITDAADTIIGTEAASNTDTMQRSFVHGQFTIASQKTFELQHRCQLTDATVGFGIAKNFGVVEVYTEVEIWQIP